MSSETDAAVLRRGARRLGLSLGPREQGLLVAYAAEVARWGRRINLTGARDGAEFIKNHVLDSVSILPLLGIAPGKAWADVGSGAGVPGIPLAVLTPGTRWFLVEPREKRWAFLVHVVHALGLAGVEVVRARAGAETDAGAGAIAPLSLDGVVSRALGAPALACHAWLKPGGSVALYGGPDRDRWPDAGGLPLAPLEPVRLAAGPGGTRYLLRYRKTGA
jgi:16S rRNA (guanine(527)-N(7))-methyltransferase RsmG